ncbi:hypothetical protein GN956_G12164 [Arapaima gigas]
MRRRASRGRSESGARSAPHLVGSSLRVRGWSNEKALRKMQRTGAAREPPPPPPQARVQPYRAVTMAEGGEGEDEIQFLRTVMSPNDEEEQEEQEEDRSGVDGGSRDDRRRITILVLFAGGRGHDDVSVPAGGYDHDDCDDIDGHHQ